MERVGIVLVPCIMIFSQAGGGALEDVGDGQASNELDRDPALRRVNTARARAERNGQPPAMDKQQTLPILAIPMNLGDLKRNRSLRIKSPKVDKEKEQLQRRPSDETCKLSRSASLIKYTPTLRTKHLSLRMRRHGDKVGDDEVVDESDCKIQ
ncbi:hypothetical protein ANCDUO_18933 [Ancylostoma duodenale]|uniref:Uncharacterized protein n=1 Tax=Ancylostoma duodenale TaxID=51022 RepID=A0A0C2FWI4_9BILA|nr:hypothetical protein ANCDUO_18933 [Ancylostoma duodenale]